MSHLGRIRLLRSGPHQPLRPSGTTFASALSSKAEFAQLWSTECSFPRVGGEAQRAEGAQPPGVRSGVKPQEVAA